MSKQKRKHIYCVYLGKEKRARKKQWSDPLIYKTELSHICGALGIPRYSGTRYRGERRWR